MLTLIIILLICTLIYLLLLRGRKAAPGMEQLQGWSYAHRGLHDEERPENSLAAFQAALEQGYGIELDVHLLKDGTLAIMHDSSLKRTTGRDGIIEDLTREELSSYYLNGTDQTIPTFQQVLTMFADKAPIIIELKTHGGNAAALTKEVCQVLADYRGAYCIESFDPRVVYALKKQAPHIIRGQLAENSLKRDKNYPWIVRFLCTFLLTNVLTCPDFIAYRFEDRKNLSCTLCRKLWGIQGVAWTIRTPEEHTCAVSQGWLSIFENFLP